MSTLEEWARLFLSSCDEFLSFGSQSLSIVDPFFENKYLGLNLYKPVPNCDLIQFVAAINEGVAEQITSYCLEIPRPYSKGICKKVFSFKLLIDEKIPILKMFQVMLPEYGDLMDHLDENDKLLFKNQNIVYPTKGDIRFCVIFDNGIEPISCAREVDQIQEEEISMYHIVELMKIKK